MECLDWIVWLLGIGGLLISTRGTWLLFKGTPLDQIGIPTYVDAHVAQDEFEKAYEELHRRKGFTKTGIKLIGWGFGIQLIAQILNGPW
ncbi:hypothetical protein [Paenibacillus sp. FSL H8-0537]|uniref:hypothetical protein n=1 Tax=Paenibacillus sp. FSL H8-0537 TaxID=2921399 RepID=UPI0031015F1A